MIDKYTYYIDYGSGFVQVTPLKSSLHLIYKVDQEWPAVVDTLIEGGFYLTGSDFTSLLAIYETSGNVDVPFRIYQNGTISTGALLVTGYITDFNFYDINQSIVKINNVIASTVSTIYQNQCLANIKNKGNWYGLILFYGTPNDIISAIGYPAEKITAAGWDLQDVLNNALQNNNILITVPNLDDTDGWYSTALIDLSNIRLCPSGATYKDSTNLYEPNGDTNLNNSISADDILSWMKNGLNAHWYCDGSSLKFKRIQDLISNTLDISSQTTHLNQLNYDPEQNYQHTKLFGSSNNDFDADVDFQANFITYDRASKLSDEVDLRLQTLYGRFDDIDTSTWFIGYVNPANDTIRYEAGYLSEDDKDNARFSTANLLNTYHREYLYTDKINFDVCGNASLVAPEYFRPYIQMPDFVTKLDTVQFYDSLLWKKSGGFNYICRVIYQDTDLETNITTFKSHLFRKQSTS